MLGFLWGWRSSPEWNCGSQNKQLTLVSRKILLHAQHFLAEYISSMLWPFSLLATAGRITNMHIDMNGLTPTINFSQWLTLRYG